LVQRSFFKSFFKSKPRIKHSNRRAATFDEAVEAATVLAVGAAPLGTKIREKSVKL
jgi:hypothetical protein